MAEHICHIFSIMKIMNQIYYMHRKYKVSGNYIYLIIKNLIVFLHTKKIIYMNVIPLYISINLYKNTYYHICLRMPYPGQRYFKALLFKTFEDLLNDVNVEHITLQKCEYATLNANYYISSSSKECSYLQVFKNCRI